MKHLPHICISILFVTLAAVSCRKEADPTLYYNEVTKLAYNDYAGQFEYIWKHLDTGYVFWDIDTTPWDEVYDEFLPKFRDLDRRVSGGETIPDTEFEELYTSAMGNMVDHHMVIYVRNLHPAAGDEGIINISPGMICYYNRAEFIDRNPINSFKNFLDNLESEYSDDGAIKIKEHVQFSFNIKGTPDSDTNGLTYSFNLFELPDGRLVPYLWQNKARIATVFKYSNLSEDIKKGESILDHFFTLVATLPKDKIAGFIIDNRCNTGGIQDDLDYLIGSFINERTVMMKTRYKEGPGRLEYSPWTNYYQEPVRKYHRDITAENIPYVYLEDIISISMGEIEPMVAKAVFNTAYVIGERSFGATGPLQADQFSLTYAGIFGNSQMNEGDGHYIYTPHFETSFNGRIYEGKGLEPDLEVIRKEHGNSWRAAIDAALNYCEKY